MTAAAAAVAPDVPAASTDRQGSGAPGGASSAWPSSKPAREAWHPPAPRGCVEPSSAPSPPTSANTSPRNDSVRRSSRGPAPSGGPTSADERQTCRRLRQRVRARGCPMAALLRRARHALEYVREELRTALHPEAAIQGRHVLVDRGGA